MGKEGFACRRFAPLSSEESRFGDVKSVMKFNRVVYT